MTSSKGQTCAQLSGIPNAVWANATLKVRRGQYTRSSARPGTTFRSMCFGVGDVSVIRHVQWAGNGPLRGRKIIVDHGGVRFEISVPDGCANVTVNITKFVPDREIAWTIVGVIKPPLGHVYGYTLESVDAGTLVTSYYDWSDIDPVWKEAAVFDKRQLADLVQGLANDPPLYFDRGAVIIREGATGVRMYTVLEGRVEVTIEGSKVERIGPGGVFGEAALLDQAARLASVRAETDCALQPIGRTAFLELVKVSPAFAEKMLANLAARLRLLAARLN